MFTTDDLIDAILEDLRPRFIGAQTAAAPVNVKASASASTTKRPSLWKPDLRPKGRRFLTEAEVKKALTPGTPHLTIPKDAIISPLAQDWLALQGIQIVRE